MQLNRKKKKADTKTLTNSAGYERLGHQKSILHCSFLSQFSYTLEVQLKPTPRMLFNKAFTLQPIFTHYHYN